jgi:nucleotide-binding universal stress UspA family protein
MGGRADDGRWSEREALDMYSKIIVGYEGTESAQDALTFGKLLAEATGAHLVVAGVFRVVPVWDVRDAAVDRWAPDHTAQLEAAAASVGGEAVTIPSTSEAWGLEELAERIGADLVIVGSASRGKIGHVLAGDVGLSLLHGAPCSVGVAPQGFAGAAPERLDRVTVAYDGNPESQAALREAVDLARGAGAALRVVCVAEPPPIVYGKGGGANQGWHELREAIEELLRTRLDEALAELPDDLQAEGVLLSGHPAEELARVAAEDGGVLALGSRSYGSIRGVLLGSVSRDLMRSAPAPLIVHPRSAGAHAPAAVRAAASGGAVL